MIKGELIDLFSLYMQQEDETARYHPRVIEFALEPVYEGMISELIVTGALNADLLTTRSATLPVFEDADGFRYVAYPKNIMPLLKTESGVRSINTTGDYEYFFYPTTRDEIGDMTGSDVDIITESIWYWIEPDGVKFKDIPDSIKNTGVVMRYIPSFSAMDDGDRVYVPDMKRVELFSAAKQKLSSIPPKDFKQNNSDLK